MTASWAVPRDWAGERCFVLCGGESLRCQRHLVPQLRGRIVAIKHAVLLRPDADVMFVSGRDDPKVCRDLFPVFTGTHTVCRNSYPGFPPQVKCLARAKPADRLSDAPTHVAGLDAGTSAINLAYLFGATEIVLLGFDMTGGRWFNGEIAHHMPFPPPAHFARHKASLPTIAADLAARGVRVVNCSPVTTVTAFERQPLEAFL